MENGGKRTKVSISSPKLVDILQNNVKLRNLSFLQTPPQEKPKKKNKQQFDRDIFPRLTLKEHILNSFKGLNHSQEIDQKRKDRFTTELFLTNGLRELFFPPSFDFVFFFAQS